MALFSALWSLSSRWREVGRETKRHKSRHKHFGGRNGQEELDTIDSANLKDDGPADSTNVRFIWQDEWHVSVDTKIFDSLGKRNAY